MKCGSSGELKSRLYESLTVPLSMVVIMCLSGVLHVLDVSNYVLCTGSKLALLSADSVPNTKRHSQLNCYIQFLPFGV